MSETAGNGSGVGAAAPAAAALHSLDSYDVIYDAGQEHSDDMQSVSHMDWPFLIKGILENSQTCAPTTPETLAALLWAIIAVFGIVYALLGYRCLRAVGFLSGLMVGANGIFILQDFQITWLGKPADSALAIVAGLLGAVLGSTYPVASVLISAFAGALLSGAAMAVCVATMPDNEFGVSPPSYCKINIYL
ncbi:hypothetical protein AWZ03_013616 [Drosophila navojoa]|uniref:Transmembrane protein 198 n=1 Tax=Drosophila navojoa TaxID=7232 RepID=A0A484AWN5_DRONA|nr:transmembrane protein 198-like [Drosophila navojoa]TDG39965.1 hypothetical protein AWZ03_013616 [Drosophila navojoa]